MAVAQKSAQEIQVEQLSQLVEKLKAEQKAKESAIRHLNDQLALADANLVLKLKSVQDAFEAKQEALRIACLPLEHLASQVEPLKAEIARLKQEKADAVAEIRAAKGSVVKEANDKVQAASSRLSAIEVAINLCKTKVAAL